MIIQPFSFLQSFSTFVEVRYFSKSDMIRNDDQVADAFHHCQYSSLNQVHGDMTLITRKPEQGKEADGMITDTKDLLLITRAADCQSFVIYAPTANIVGVLHAGWKGIRDGVIPSFFKVLTDELKVDVKDTFVGAAPSLCIDCAEFTDPKTELSGIDASFFSGRNADLRGIADSQLLSVGVQPNHMERMSGCPSCDTRTYWSLRGGDSVKMAEGYRNILACRLK